MRRGGTLASSNPSRHRGVSPILGVILLVAIMVVLAALLYVMVAELAPSSGGKTPIGYSLALGPAQEFTGTRATGAYCAINHACYQIAIASVGTGVTLGSVDFVLKTASGATRVVQGGPAQISIVGPAGSAVAFTSIAKNTPLVVSGWTKYLPGFSANDPLESWMTICLQFGDTKLNPVGQGFVLDVVGAGQFSGVEAFALP